MPHSPELEQLKEATEEPVREDTVSAPSEPENGSEEEQNEGDPGQTAESRDVNLEDSSFAQTQSKRETKPVKNLMTDSPGKSSDCPL